MNKEDSDSDSTDSSVDAVDSIDIGSTMYRIPADMFLTSPADLAVTKSAKDDVELAGEEESRFGLGFKNFNGPKIPRRRSESDISTLLAPARRATAE